MTTVTVIGAGNFGSVVAGIAGIAAKGGTGVQVLARDAGKISWGGGLAVVS